MFLALSILAAIGATLMLVLSLSLRRSPPVLSPPWDLVISGYMLAGLMFALHHYGI
jgi:hypothetical protein